jgi:transposase
MARSLSLDLRQRVVGAVGAGMSCRQAAERFGVSAASAVRWCALQRSVGSPAARAMGGDRHSRRIEAQAELILALVSQTNDITLMELQTKLAEQGHRFAIGTLWRFFDRHEITWKKDHTRERAGPSGHRRAAAGVV